DVLAEQDDFRIAGHLLVEGLVDRLDITFACHFGDLQALRSTNIRSNGSSGSAGSDSSANFTAASTWAATRSAIACTCCALMRPSASSVALNRSTGSLAIQVSISLCSRYLDCQGSRGTVQSN